MTSEGVMNSIEQECSNKRTRGSIIVEGGLKKFSFLDEIYANMLKEQDFDELVFVMIRFSQAQTY